MQHHMIDLSKVKPWRAMARRNRKQNAERNADKS